MFLFIFFFYFLLYFYPFVVSPLGFLKWNNRENLSTTCSRSRDVQQTARVSTSEGVMLTSWRLAVEFGKFFTFVYPRNVYCQLKTVVHFILHEMCKLKLDYRWKKHLVLCQEEVMSILKCVWAQYTFIHINLKFSVPVVGINNWKII